jgi:hypothetical protein
MVRIWEVAIMVHTVWSRRSDFLKWKVFWIMGETVHFWDTNAKQLALLSHGSTEFCIFHSASPCNKTTVLLSSFCAIFKFLDGFFFAWRNTQRRSYGPSFIGQSHPNNPAVPRQPMVMKPTIPTPAAPQTYRPGRVLIHHRPAPTTSLLNDAWFPHVKPNSLQVN